MPVAYHTVTIPAGQAMSNGVDFASLRLVRVRMPDAWTPGANITSQLSPDGIVPYSTLYMPGGLFQMVVFPGMTLVVIDSWPSMEFVRIVSGTETSPHIQAADRIFTFATDSKAGTAAQLPTGG